MIVRPPALELVAGRDLGAAQLVGELLLDRPHEVRRHPSWRGLLGTTTGHPSRPSKLGRRELVPDSGVRPSARRSRIWLRRWTTVMSSGTISSCLAAAHESSAISVLSAARSAFFTRS